MKVYYYDMVSAAFALRGFHTGMDACYALCNCGDFSRDTIESAVRSIESTLNRAENDNITLGTDEEYLVWEMALDTLKDVLKYGVTEEE